MSTPDTSPQLLAVPVVTITHIAELLTRLDNIIRTNRSTIDSLAADMACHGSSHPSYDTNTLIDELSFAALSLRQLVATIDTPDDPTA